MGIISVLIILVCICVDNMVSSNMSALKLNKENKSIFSVKLALVFAGFNVLWLAVGYIISAIFFNHWVYFAHNWVAFAFLLLLGIKLMLESIEKSPSFGDADVKSMAKLLKISAWIGLNALLAGYAMHTMGRHFFPDALWLLIITFVLTLLGAHLGGKDSKTLLSKRLELAAGIVLIILGIRMIII